MHARTVQDIYELSVPSSVWKTFEVWSVHVDGQTLSEWNSVTYQLTHLCWIIPPEN